MEGERASWINRDTLITMLMLALASALAWWWLLSADMSGMAMSGPQSAAPMGNITAKEGMTGMNPASPASWTAAYAFSVFVMWVIMMVAMMLPSALPMILLHARVTARNLSTAALAATLVFAVTYVAVWVTFSAAATAVQWFLSDTGLIGPSMALSNRAIGGGLLIGAGLYQLTPLKTYCLKHCRGPITFLTLHWRPGIRGALGMGLSHGGYCVGCCWFIMALLFVGGVMNMVWVVAIAAFVLAEKILPFGERVTQVAGLVALATGAYFVVS